MVVAFTSAAATPSSFGASLVILLLCCSSSPMRLAEAFSSSPYHCHSTSNLFRPVPQQRQTDKRKNKRIVAHSRSWFHRIRTPQQQERQPWRRQNYELNASSSSQDSSSDSSTTAAATTAATVNGQDNLTKLKAENKLLQERLKLLQSQNEQLLKQLQQQEQGGKYGDNNHKKPYEQRLVLEDFEGEETFFNGWNKREKRYVDELNTFDDGFDGDDYEEEDNAAFLPSAVSSTSSSTAVSVAVKNIGITGDDDDDDELGLAGVDEDELICEYDDKSGLFKNSIGECPVEPNVTFLDAMKSRAYWLVGLLALQSCSGFILSRNELLLQDHPVIVYFLTMLVGAGGNAGNQASVRVIRGLALGTLNSTTQTQFLSRELRMAFALSAILSLAGFFRAIVFQTPFPETMAVTLALSMIVFSSICLGAILPLVLQKMGVDPAHSSTTIQVIMDILGVVLTVFVSTAVLDSVWGKMLVKSLSSVGL